MTTPIPTADAVADDTMRWLLRMDGSNPDAERVRTLAGAVLELIRHRLGLDVFYPDGAVPGLVLEAAIQATRELYLRKDSPQGITGAWGDNGEPIRVARDPLAGVEYLLAPYQQTAWPVA